ncbi:MAG: DUF3857 domain-containing protein [Bacteroidota bacterium]
MRLFHLEKNDLMIAKKVLLFFVCFTILLQNSVAGKSREELAVDKIPKGLLINANAVVRSYHRVMDIAKVDNITVSDEYAITIFNEQGKKYATLYSTYDKMRKIKSISGFLYDKDGKLVKYAKKKDILDYSMSSFIFFDDYRCKSIDFNYSSYPYTVVYTIEYTNHYSYWIPEWEPSPGRDCAIVSANADITYTHNIPLRYRTFHINDSLQSIENGGKQRLSLTLADIPAKGNTELLPTETFFLPTLILASDSFSIDGYNGRMSNWAEFGKFFYQLNANRDELPMDKKVIVHHLTDTCKSDYSKIKVLYEYLKHNTRYVCIVLGIGGFQTYDAKYVAEKGYGDCKALSNYMMAMLKEVGIKSYATLVYGGKDERRTMQLDFPYYAFNHIILCVPQGQDTTWLECTSKTLPAGHLSSFTNHRNVLLMTEDGGKVATTNESNDADNVLRRNAVVRFDKQDDILANINLHLSGEYWDIASSYLSEKSTSEQEKFVNEFVSIPTFTISDTKINNKEERSPNMDIVFSLKGNGTIRHTSQRVFLSTNFFKHNVTFPSNHEIRIEPFEIRYTLNIIDTISIQMPENYSVDELPKEVNIKYAFGSYTGKVYLENGGLKLAVSFMQQKGIYSAAEFGEYLAFCKAIKHGVGDIVLKNTK